MTNDFLQQKIGEIIYILGEHNFNVIKGEAWEKYINENQPFNEKQLNDFRLYIESLIEDAEEAKMTETKNETQKAVDAAIQILKEVGLKELEVCRFGIYRQYEVAGEKVSVYVMDEGTEEEEAALGDRWEELYELLEFIDEDYIYDVLGYDDEGQNTLILTYNGFKQGSFSI
jgi:hypothetical protein